MKKPVEKKRKFTEAQKLAMLGIFMSLAIVGMVMVADGLAELLPPGLLRVLYRLLVGGGFAVFGLLYTWELRLR